MKICLLLIANLIYDLVFDIAIAFLIENYCIVVERVMTVNLRVQDSFRDHVCRQFKQPIEIDNIQFPSSCSYRPLLLV